MITNGECLLNSVSVGATAVTGGWVPVYGTRGNYSFQTKITGSPTAGLISYQGSLNGVDAIDLTTFDIASDVTTTLNRVIDNPVSFIRAIVGAVTGGTAPRVSSWMSAS